MNLYHEKQQPKIKIKNQTHQLSFQISLTILLIATCDIRKINIPVSGKGNNAKTELEALK